MAPNQSNKINLVCFCSCSTEDEKLETIFVKHLDQLQSDGAVLWQNSKIDPGLDRSKEIDGKLNSAHIILLLISPDFTTRNDIILRSIERHEKAEDSCCVIPVLLRDCLWNSQLQALPRDGQFIVNSENKDKAFKEVAEEIRKAIQNKSDYIKLPQKDKKQFQALKRRIISTITISMMMTVLVTFMRLIGLLEGSELFFYDQMLPSEISDKDENLLLVEIDLQDSEYFGDGYSLSNDNLYNLLNKLKSLHPRIIGIDLYRDLPNKKSEKLERFFKENPKLIVATCGVTSNNGKNPGNPPPVGVPKEQIGFSNFFLENQVVRRQMIKMSNTGTDIKDDDPCFGKRKEMDSFNFKLVQNYLEKAGKNIYSKKEDETNLKSGNAVLQRIHGSTQGLFLPMNSDLGGYQILLDYRIKCSKCTLKDVFTIKHARDLLRYNDTILKDEGLQNDVKNKIVLIGTNLKGVDSRAKSPYGHTSVQGFTFQAQMVSHLLSAALGEKSLIKVLSLYYEMLWIFV